MNEWKAVETKGVTWLVSRNGEVKAPAHSCSYVRERNGKHQTMTANFPERVLSPYKTKSGYLEVAAMNGGKRVKATVHRLIGMAFVEGYADDLTINHINGDKTDNRVENIEWVSLARNTEHEWKTGLVDLRGENQPGAKLTTKQVVYIRRLLKQGIAAHTLAVIAGVSDSTVALIRDGKRWAHVTE